VTCEAYMVEIERRHLQNLQFVLLLTFLGQYFHYLSETKIWVETFLLLAEMPMNDCGPFLWDIVYCGVLLVASSAEKSVAHVYFCQCLVTSTVILY